MKKIEKITSLGITVSMILLLTLGFTLYTSNWTIITDILNVLQRESLNYTTWVKGY